MSRVPRAVVVASLLVLTCTFALAVAVDAAEPNAVAWFDVSAAVVSGSPPALDAGSCNRKSVPADLDGAAFAAAFGGSEVTALGRTRVDIGEPRMDVAPRMQAILRAGDPLVYFVLGGRATGERATSAEVALKLQLLGAKKPLVTDGVVVAPGARIAFAAPLPGSGCLVVTVTPRTFSDVAAPGDTWQYRGGENIRKWSFPERPDTVRGMKHHGAVKVGVKLQPDGRAAFVRALEFPQGAEDLALSAMTSVMRWTFEPEPQSTLVLVWYAARDIFEPAGSTTTARKGVSSRAGVMVEHGQQAVPGVETP